jgi:O-antigen/teichoic acid export membrane protein
MKQDNLSLTSITLQGTFWAYVSTYGGKVLAFVTTAILARLLLKEDFGIAGYALIVIGFLETINGLGVGSALIYFPVDMERNSSAFWLGLSIGILLFVAAWFVAPLVGIFFNDVRAVSVTRVLALTFPLSAFGIIHEAILRKNLAFKTKAIPDFVRTLSKGVISVVLAVLGFGAWSLIIGQLTGVVFSVIAYWGVVSWRPSFQIAPKYLQPLISYGFSIVSVNTLGVIIHNADYLLVGRYLGAAALGVYTLAFRVPDLLIGQFADIMGQVLFPVYSRMAGDSDLIKRGLFVTLRYVSLITVPIGLGLAVIAEPFVLTFFTNRWAEVIPIMAIISIASVLNSLSYNFGDVYKAKGQPEVLTKLSIFRAVVLLPSLWWAVAGHGTLLAVSWAVAFVSFIGTVSQILVAKFVIGMSVRGILDALRPAILSGVVMALVVYGALVFLNGLAPLLQMIMAVCVGLFVYAGMLWLFQRKDAVEAFQVFRESFLRR